MNRFVADVALVTHAAGELGGQFVAEFLVEGASRVYAVNGTGRTWSDSRVAPIESAGTDAGSIGRLRDIASDVTIVVCNLSPEPRIVPVAAVDSGAFSDLIDTNVLEVVRLASAFAPVLANNGRGVFAVVQSVQAWISVNGPYAASQAARWSVTNSLRVELADAGVHVIGLVSGLTMEDTTGDPSRPQANPPAVAKAALDGIAAGAYEVLADEYCRSVKSRLSRRVAAIYPELRRR
jgi:NAD(P)-dependent dehydrogenase (short-subunit alcohol dehydrogenase family)